VLLRLSACHPSVPSSRGLWSCGLSGGRAGLLADPDGG
jgi:hypothetical protein